MKNIFAILSAVLMMMAVSCQKVSPLAEQKIKVQIEVADLDPGTKAIKTGWETGDKINIWFGDAYWTVLPQLVLTRTASGWESSEVDESILSASGTFKAIYEASNKLFESEISGKYAYYTPTRLEFNTGSSNGGANVRPMQVACCANGVSYSYNSETKELSATISDWEAMTKQQVVVTGLSGDPGDYAMTFHGNTYGVDHFLYSSSGIIEGEGAICNGVDNAYNWTQGVANTDGIAFNFGGYFFPDGSVITAGASWTFGLYLYDMKNEKMYHASFEVVPKNLVDRFIIAYKIPFTGRFTEYTD